MITFVRRHYILLLAMALLVLAGGLFVWGSGFGLPQLFHDDEPQIVTRAVNVAAGAWHGEWYDWPASFQISALGSVYRFMELLHETVLRSPLSVTSWFHANPSLFYLVARMLTAGAALITLAATFLIGRSIRSPRVGLIAMLLLTTSYSFGRHAHFATPDMLLTCFIVLATYFSLRARELASKRFLALAALATGLATAMKYPGILAGVPVVAAWADIKEKRSSKLGRAVMLFMIFLAAFTFATPFFWFDLRSVAADIGRVLTTLHVGKIDTSLLGRAEFYVLGILPVGIGVVTILMAAGGIMLSLTKRYRRALPLLAFVFPYALFLLAFHSTWERYALPLFPFLALFAGVACDAFLNSFQKQKKLSRGIVTALLIIAIAPPLSRLIITDHLLSSTDRDSRALARAWVLEHIPRGSFIVRENQTPEFPQNLFRVERVQYLSNASLDAYRGRGVQYCIASGEMYGRFTGKQAYQREQTFYQTLFATQDELFRKDAEVNQLNAALVKNDWRWAQWSVTHFSSLAGLSPGPTIRIFRLQ